MSNNKVAAVAREKFGKGAARKLRAVGQVPAVLYGHGTDPVHVSLPAHEMSLIIRRANALIELDITGKAELALVKDVQKDPVRQIIEHIDLLLVKKGEKVQVEVPVHLEGEAAAGTTVGQEHNVLSIEAEATHIPTAIVVSIEGLGEGTQILAKDVQLPKGVTLVTDPEALVVNITVAAVQDLGEETEAEAASETESETEPESE